MKATFKKLTLNAPLMVASACLWGQTVTAAENIVPWKSPEGLYLMAECVGGPDGEISKKVDREVKEFDDILTQLLNNNDFDGAADFIQAKVNTEAISLVSKNLGDSRNTAIKQIVAGLRKLDDGGDKVSLRPLVSLGAQLQTRNKLIGPAVIRMERDFDSQDEEWCGYYTSVAGQTDLSFVNLYHTENVSSGLVIKTPFPVLELIEAVKAARFVTVSSSAVIGKPKLDVVANYWSLKSIAMDAMIARFGIDMTEAQMNACDQKIMSACEDLIYLKALTDNDLNVCAQKNAALCQK